MYPKFIEHGKKEKASDAAILSFDVANQVKRSMQVFTKKHLTTWKNKETDYYVCQICGNTVEGEAPDRCPICNAPKEMFQKGRLR